MGLRKETISYIHAMVNMVGFKLEGLRMCEFGNQHLKDGYKGFSTAKKYFESLGVYHISIDLNGKDGALALNLNTEIDFKKLGQFDVVTNMGTSEHVQNNDQCFENIHNLCRDGGIMIHLVPAFGTIHGRRQYTLEWLNSISEIKGYKVLYGVKKINRTTNYIYFTVQK
jgi:SAM-dependent methyltransferase